MNDKQKRKPYRKGLKADYQGATPEQVARALHRYRPGQPVRHGKEACESTARDQV